VRGPASRPPPARGAGELSETTQAFERRFEALFETQYPRLYRWLQRLSGEPELAADLAQEAFVRLYRRGTMPDAPEAWLISVAMNLFRNERTTRARRLRLLDAARGGLGDSAAATDPEIDPGESRRVREALGRVSDRERTLLLLRAEGYAYRDIARALGIHEASVGTLLARARRAFRAAYGEGADAP